MVAKNAMSTTADSEAIAITGVGLVTPFGAGVEPLYDALGSGRSALQPSEAVGRWVPRGEGPEEGRAIAVGQVGDFGAKEVIDGGKLRRMPRVGQFCVVAGRQALAMAPGAQAADVVARYGGERVGVVLGTGLGSLDQVMDFTAAHLKDGPESASPALFPTTVMNTGAALVAMELRLLGPNITVNHRDLSTLEALATARDQLLRGRADAVLAGGFEEIGPWLAHGYARLGALSRIGAPMRPYDRRRDGLALGEGAALFLLERAADARRRGAPVLALLAGLGRGGDDRPRVGWRRPGEPIPVTGGAAAIGAALAQADVAPDAIDYVAGGGNGTDLDLVETATLRAALGGAAERVPISSMLAQSGESMMSAGLRAASALYALGKQALPGTAACEEPDPEASLPGLCRAPRPARVRSVLVPALAQGGGAVALVLRQP